MVSGGLAAVTPGRLRQANPTASASKMTNAPTSANMTTIDLAMNLAKRISDYDNGGTAWSKDGSIEAVFLG